MARGFIHDRILLDPLEAYLHGIGGRTYREYRIGPGRRTGIVDLFVEYESHRIAIEAELSPDRVDNDVAKAMALRADLLLIIVPEHRIARAVTKRLQRRLTHRTAKGLEIWILPLGTALRRLMKKFPLMSSVKVPMTSSHQYATSQPRDSKAALEQGGES